MINYDAPTPEMDAFMSRIDDSEVDMRQVENQLKKLECERDQALKNSDVFRGLVLALEYLRSVCEHAPDYTRRQRDEALLSGMSVGIRALSEVRELLPGFQTSSYWSQVSKNVERLLALRDPVRKLPSFLAEYCRIHNATVEAANDFGCRADKARSNALKHPEGSVKRKRSLAVSRAWALAEARMRSIVENSYQAPDYKRVREPYPPY